MLKRDERRLRQLARINIGGSLPGSPSLLGDLIRFLNETKSSKGKKIVKILEQMLELEEMTRPINPEEPMIVAVEWKRTAPAKYKVHWEIEKLRAKLQAALSSYTFTAHAEVMGGSGGTGPSEWAVWWRDDSDFRSKEPIRMKPGEALELILKLTQVGDLVRLRRCAQCQEWLFARFRHQAFCSTKCQQKKYTQTDAWKDRRRNYMRRYYRQNLSKVR